MTRPYLQKIRQVIIIVKVNKMIINIIILKIMMIKMIIIIITILMIVMISPGMDGCEEVGDRVMMI